MNELTERDLRLTLSGRAIGRQLDNFEHGLSHCGLKAVDWVLELPDWIYFIEVKDPDDPQATRHNNRDNFLRSFRAGRLTLDLAAKFGDSFLYEWACDRVNKPISYVVIVASAALDDAQLLTRTDDLKRRLPAGTPAGWVRPMAHDCFVFNVAKWNKVFPRYPLSRHSVAEERA